MKLFWTSDKLDFIRKNLHLSDSELANHFYTSISAIKQVRAHNKIARFPNRRFTAAQDAIIIELYENTLTEEIAAKLNKPIYAVYNRASRLGLQKSKAFVSNLAKTYLQESGKAHRYEKGHVPANKGQSMPDELKERIKHTWFPKGHKPHNTQKDGFITTRTDTRTGIKYKYIRVSEGVWEDLKRHMWETENGPIPSGFNVVFKANSPGIYKLSNFELISNAELLERNTLHQWPDELQQVIRLNNKLKKQINGRH